MKELKGNYVNWRDVKLHNYVPKYGYIERTSCIGCVSGFQPRSFNFAAGSRSHRGFFMVTWTLRISAFRNTKLRYKWL